MRRGIRLVMSAATLLVVGVAFRASAQPHPDAGATSFVAPDRPRHTSARPTPRTPSRASSTRPRPTTPGSPARRRPATAAVTVAGGVVDTPYGPVQVEITVNGGRIAKARTVTRPSGDGQTDAINSYAVPRLDQETLDAQSARIDTVSGATFTSAGYRESLQSALDAAHRAGAR